MSADIGEISYPRLVRLVYFKFSIQNVRGYVAKIATFKPSVPFVTTLRAQTGLLHDSVNAVFAATLTVVFHVQRDGPVNATIALDIALWKGGSGDLSPVRAS